MLSVIDSSVGVKPISSQLNSLPHQTVYQQKTEKGMNRYVMLSQLGDGTYGTVMLAQRLDTGEKVAIKK